MLNSHKSFARGFRVASRPPMLRISIMAGHASATGVFNNPIAAYCIIRPLERVNVAHWLCRSFSFIPQNSRLLGVSIFYNYIPDYIICCPRVTAKRRQRSNRGPCSTLFYAHTCAHPVTTFFQRLKIGVIGSLGQSESLSQHHVLV